MVLVLSEYEALEHDEEERLCRITADIFIEAGADKVFYTMEDLVEFRLG